MKNLPILLLCSLLSQNVIAQISMPLFYNDSWKLCDRADATYYRTAIVDTTNLIFIGAIKDFYRTSQVKMEGNYFQGKKEGRFTFYYPNGQVEKSGIYKNGMRDSVWIYYHANGNIKRKVQFEGGDFSVIYEATTEGNTHVVNGTGEWHYTFWDLGMLDSLTIEGYFENYKKDGLWKMSNREGEVLFEEKFKNGEFLKSKYFNIAAKTTVKLSFEVKNKFQEPNQIVLPEIFALSDKSMIEKYPFTQKFNDNSGLAVYKFDTSPEYLDSGLDGFYMKIGQNLSYPKEAQESGLEGKVFIRFEVNQFGIPCRFSIDQDIDSMFGEEALRVIKLTDLWKPAQKNGKPIHSTIVFPINFSLP